MAALGCGTHSAISSAVFGIGSDTSHLAAVKPCCIWSANEYASTFPLKKINSTNSFGLPSSALANLPISIRRGPSRNISTSASLTRAFASAARVFASAARFIASASLTFERLRNAVWIRLFHMPNTTSPTIPTATPASGTTESFKNRPYDGSMIAMISSAMMEIMTSAPHQILHRSHDSDAPSNSFSSALFVPFGRYHAGKNGFRTLFFALLIWSLMAAFLLGAVYLWGNT